MMDKIFPFLAALSLIVMSCDRREPFDKNLWNHKNNIGYPDRRDAMLDDLLKKHKLKGKHFDEIEKLFGGPLEIDTALQNDITFNIVTDFGWDIDPVYEKNLTLIFNEDSIVINWYVYEYPE